ncbi:hypothetical protein BO70DRAFT_360507 [Aspergillus heteromorphus CBS 117.55]|uniref:BZIP domain-containing protein n=1 Tax=Aspergillus heteromorphus CBS 117.55 TaxID=1448321 RepID=A0A317WNZ7_9EURO|nr:uncharacterized protein BO70DRAFT_360507 [Aspergillus heteromorphus CBS 117.55]PWY86797.1 hypothetical protein BO70DRAFT_360507 [Aspergillus heteromorphus CBS 117.55]
MATLAEHPAVAPSSFDQDIESFLNLDQLAYTTAEPVRSKTALVSQPTLPSTEFNAGEVRSAGFAQTNPLPVAYQGPSHQYDEHKQQTGLPPGALAHAMTFNNHMNGMGYGAPSPGYAMNGGDMYAANQLKREEAPLDFNSPPSRPHSEMDLESDSMGTVPAYFISPNPSNKSQFIDPNALGGQEVVPAGPSTQVGRMYPGMHQQQAAMAKAAQQQKHHELLRQQHIQQQRRVEEHMQQNGAPHSQTPRPPNAGVDERISRLLQQMRQSAMSSPDGSPSPSMLPQMAKAKKDEQDMDEDERLLASEEGKKLSSKERRQLRNKVSARAFRSRRKEYIGQLESEVAAKTNEAHDLRLQNRALFEENARLTDLARMLLSSPNFSQFLDEMGPNGVSIPSHVQPHPHSQHHQHPQQPQPQQQPSQQQAPLSQPPMQQPQVGMVMVPNQGLDVSAMGLNNGGWNSGIDMNYGNANVFAVLEVPEPVIDTEALSRKSPSLGEYCLPSIPSSKDEAPVLESMPTLVKAEGQSTIGVENPDIVIDESDPAFALFTDNPAASISESTTLFSGVPAGKTTPAFELVVAGEVRDSSKRFAHLCHSMEAAFERVSMMTAHLL